MKQQLKKLLGDGKTKKVITHLRERMDLLDEELQEEIIIQSSRFEVMNREKRSGILSKDQELIQLSKINAALINIINDLPEEIKIISAPKRKISNWLTAAITVGILIISSPIIYNNYLRKEPSITSSPDLSEDNRDSTPQISEKENNASHEKEQQEPPSPINPKDSPNTNPTLKEERSPKSQITKNELIKEEKTSSSASSEIPVFNNKFSGNLAIAGKEADDRSINTLQKVLSNEGHSISNSFFTRAYLDKAFNSLFVQGLINSKLSDFPETLQCICLIEEEFEYINKNRYGQDFLNIKGTVRLKLLYLNNNPSSSWILEPGGAGADKNTAHASFADNFKKLLFRDGVVEKLQQCKN